MRLVGQQSPFESFSAVFAARVLRASLGLLLPGALLLGASPVSAQTAPYVLPYTMSTYAGPHAAYTAGGACATNSKLVALNAAGDGCPAASVSVGADPHDVRVDARGNVFYIDNGSTILIHKISPQTGQQTVYVGNRVCANAADTYGDGCPANDGAANNNTASNPTSSKFKAQRGLSMAPNGDLYSAGYNDYEVHRIAASTGILSLVAGNGTNNTTSFTGTSATGTGLSSTRGVGVDAAGNVFIADTGNNIIQEVPATGAQAGQLIAVTAANAGGAKTLANGPAAAATVNAPEDVQVDSNGNIYIADYGNYAIRAIYSGKGTLPGISNPQAGYIYTIAGSGVAPSPPGNSAGTPVAFTYATDGTTPTVSPTSVALQIRKLAIDSFNNVYLADSTFNVVWFIDSNSGAMRLLAGRYGASAVIGSTTVPGQPALGCAAATASGSTVGDGCPGSAASLYAASDMGVSADTQGNLYITDAEGSAPSARIRKLLSGLVFPAVTIGSSLTQPLLLHFAVKDTPAAASPFAINGAAFAAGTPSCTPNADGTDDCLLPVTFTPTFAGYQTASLTITSAAGGVTTYLLTGIATGASLSLDPGYLTSFNTSVNNAQGVTADVAGNLYIADTGNNRVLRYNAATGTTTPFAGTGTAGFTGDNGPATAATLKAPSAVAVDTTGFVYITDTGNNVVRRVSPTGIIATYAGGGSTCSSAANACAATSTALSGPTGIAADNFGQIYVADTGNNVIRQISSDGFIFTLAGGGFAGACPTDLTATPHATDTQNDGCAGLQGIFSSPSGLAYDGVGNFLVVADPGNNIVRKILLANTITVTGTSTGTASVNPLTLVAGNGQAGTSVASDGSAIKSQLNAPRGVTVDAAEDVIIADTGNAAIRFVNNTTGSISTIAGVLGASGAGTVPGSSTAVQLSNPAAVTLTAGNNLLIADSGNNRVLADNRLQVTYNFGRVNLSTSSPATVFTETSTGTVATGSLPAPPFTMAGSSDFSLTAPSSSGCTTGSLAVGASCLLNAIFTPSNPGTEQATFTETGALPAGAPPLISLVGIGAVLTRTTSTLAQTSPASGNPQFGGNFTLTATVTAQACNTTGAPACYPTGTVTFAVDGSTFGSPVPLSTPGSTTATAATAAQVISGLSTGSHTAACYYSGDDFYGASSCGNLTITVAQASTTSTLAVATSGRPQYPTTNCTTYTSGPLVGDSLCTAETLTATVISNTSGVPTGTVTFYNGGTALGSPTIGSTGVATLALTFLVDVNGNLVSDSSLPAGSYSLTCSYNGAPNFATSKCGAVPFTVVAQAAAISLTPRGCPLTGLYQPGTANALEQGVCNTGSANTNTTTGGSANGDIMLNGFPVVATADGSTTDATIFINRSNTVSGNVSIACSGLPQYSICTFAPSINTITATSGYAAPYAIDVTLWTDIRPGNATSSVHAPSLGPDHDASHGATLAMLLGWPLTLLGLGAVVRSRRRGSRVLPWLAALLVMIGSVTALSGCGAGGPGVDKVVLTPAGTYPISIKVTVGGATQSTTVYFKVGSPGIAGQQ